jgi:hypothetical protein
MSEFVHRLDDPLSSPQRLSQSVVQAAAMLGLVRAEVGRILGFKCAEFSALFEGRSVLEEGTHAYAQGELFVRLYQTLYDRTSGDGVQMVHWLRRHDKALGNAPFYLIVDEGRLAEVLQRLEAQGS